MFGHKSLLKAPQIEPKQQPEGGLKTQDNREHQAAPSTQPLASIPKVTSNGTNREGQSKTEEGCQEGTEFWPPLYGYRLKVTDTLLVAFTFFLFLATVALWWSTRRLVRSAEETAERQLRAYVFASEVRVSQFDGTPRLRIFYKNFGQTPCDKIVVSSSIEFAEVPLTRNLQIGDVRIPIAPLPPGEAAHSDVPLDISNDKRSEIQNGKSAIYIFGRIEYRDVFKKRLRYTNFRFIYTGDPNGRVKPCKDGNDYN